MFRYLLLILVLCAIGCDSTHPTLTTPPAKPTTEPFELLFGTDNYDEGRALIQTTNGDLLVAGAGNGVIAPADGTLPTPSLSRISPTGEVRWSRIFEEHRYGTAVALAETAPERFVLLTDQHNDFFNDHRLILWHFDGTRLSPIYDRAGGAVSSDATRPLLALDDGGFLLLSSDRSANGQSIGFMARLDVAGNERWGHVMQGRVDLYAAVNTEDDGFVVLGVETVSFNPFEQKILLLRFEANGTLRWIQHFDDPGGTINTISPASDGSFLLAGTRHESGSTHLYTLLVDAHGTPRSESTHDLPTPVSWAWLGALTSTPDGGYLAAGSFNQAGQTGAAFALKLSEAGDVAWLRSFSEAATYSRGYDAIVLADGNVAIAGTRGPNTPSFGGADYDNLVLVLDADGHLAQ